MTKDHREQKQTSSLIVTGIVMLFLLAMCSGCSTVVPVTARFPGPPGQTYQQACPDLQKLKDQPQLSDVSTTININYSTYYECAVKLDTWIRWYTEQQIIFESAGK
jgi:hypothetical protein